MSRLDVSSEPSMEDILASIRKIIAEEPPGSRPLPGLAAPPAKEAARVPAAASSRPVFGRAAEPMMPVEPVLTMPVAAVVPAPTGRDLGAPAQVEPRFAPLTTLEPEPQLAATPAAPSKPDAVAPMEVDAAIKSVEDQLSDLLGDDAIDTMKIAAPEPAPALAASTPAPKAFDFASMLIGRQPIKTASAPVAEPAAQEKSEPSFTVSKAGYIAEEHADATAKADDPFDFDLGPSPFKTSKLSELVLPPMKLAPAAAIPAVSKMDVDDIVTAVLENKPTLDALTTTAMIAAPEATAPAVQAFPEPVSSPVVRPAWAKVSENPAVSTAPVHVDPLPSMDIMPAPAAAMPSNATAEMAPAATAGRSMEDTVADLLRPMLRHWIQENMPKIVERALIREMTEQNLVARKTAAE